MMEAKDTVKKCDTSMTCCVDCHEVQAEISFKAGYDEAVKRHCQHNEGSLNLGRREVFECMKSHPSELKEKDVVCRWFSKAQLKVWGIEV